MEKKSTMRMEKLAGKVSRVGKRLFAIAVLPCVFVTVQAQGWEQSKVVTDSMYSNVLKTQREYTILLPKGFDKAQDKTYPVLYLLHGMWDDNKSWTAKGRVQDVYDLLVARGEAKEMVIVTPNAGGGDPNVYQNGYFDMEGWQYETFFFQEFMPYIEKKYCIKSDKKHRAVAGLSMGGGGAAAYGQHHADLFSAVYAMSALMSIPEMGAAKFDDPNGKLAKLTRSVIKHSCVDYVLKADDATKAALRSVAWYVDCGDDDFLLDRNIEFYQVMRNMNIPCQFRVRDGGHVWEYWHTALYECLPFVSRNLGE